MKTLQNPRLCGAGVWLYGARLAHTWVDGQLDEFDPPSVVMCDGVELKRATELLRASEDMETWFCDKETGGLYVHLLNHNRADLHTVQVA